jgi:toxin-antitoxin system, toxin component, bro family
MHELIKITEQNGERAVNARELHQFLEVETKFTTWIERRIEEYGFVENQDFVCLSQNWETQRKDGQRGIAVRKEYIISLDMAKELSMVERNEKGKLARLYFIEMEKKAKEPQQRLLPTNKRNQQQIELIELIRSHLLRGDVVSVAKEHGFSRNTCENVMRHRCFHPNIIKALYDKAMQNKHQLGGELQTMINNLKR